jgi:hypothetical protein
LTQTELLDLVADVLSRLGIAYMVTGSVAASFYGEPRFTNDIDIVVDLPPALISRFCASFPAEDFYLSEEAIGDAVRRRRPFNLIHPRSGLKVDFLVSRNDPFDLSRFHRSQVVELPSRQQVQFATLEDVILKKLEYFQLGGSEKHLRDIAGMLRVSGADVDEAYLEEWAARLGVGETWQELRRQLGANL